MKGIGYGITSFIYRHNFSFFFEVLSYRACRRSRGGRQSQPPLFRHKSSGKSHALRDSKDRLGCTDVVAAPDNNMNNLEKHLYANIIELKGETRRMVQGDAKPQKMAVLSHTSGVRII